MAANLRSRPTLSVASCTAPKYLPSSRLSSTNRESQQKFEDIPRRVHNGPEEVEAAFSWTVAPNFAFPIRFSV